MNLFKTRKKRIATAVIAVMGFGLMSFNIQGDEKNEVLQIDSKVVYGKPIPKDVLMAKTKIRASLGEEFAFDGISYTVVSYTFLYSPRRGDPIQVKSNRAELSKRMKSIIRDSRKGDMIIIDKIRAKGPNGVERLAPLIYRII